MNDKNAATTTVPPKDDAAATLRAELAAILAPAAERAAAADLKTFAIRIPEAESQAFHAAAGAGKASKVARLLLKAYAAGLIKL